MALHIRLIVRALVLLALLAPLRAAGDDPREAIVRLRDGSRMSGTLIERSESEVVLLIRNVRTTISMDKIDRLEVLPPLSTRYRDLRASIPDDAFGRRVELAEWLIQQGGPELAIGELDGVLRSTGSGDQIRADAERLDRYARAQVALLRDPQGKPQPQAPGRDPPPAPVTRRQLNDEQINLIRVYEFDFGESIPLEIEAGAAARIYEALADDPRLPRELASVEAIGALSALETARLLFRLRARSLYPLIRVLADPKPVREFGEIRGAWLARSCATSDCHGGSAAAGPKLSAFEEGEAYERSAMYGDWLAIVGGTLSDGTPLLDHADPGSSPLLHLGLPRGVARSPHPRVRGWKPAFRSPDSSEFERAVRWIASIRTPRPDGASVYDDPSPAEPGGPDRSAPGTP